jgi:hypothetical protein
MKLWPTYFNRKKSTDNRKLKTKNQVKEQDMKTQATLNHSHLSQPADFPAAGAMTPAIMTALMEMVSQCRGIARQAEERGDLKTALAAIKETHKLLMNLAKLDAARLKAQEARQAAQPAASAAQATAPAPEAVASARPGQAQAGAATPGAGQPNPAPPPARRQELPPNARGITNLGNIVY